MALAAVVNRGTNNNVGSTTITVSPNTTLAVGAFIVICLSERDWGITSLADNSSQAGTANSYTQNISRLTADPFSYIYSCKLTRSILNTDTITATFAGTSGGKAMTVLLLPDANSSSQFDVGASREAAAGATYTTGTTATTAQADEYAIGCMTSTNSGVEAGTITATTYTLQLGTNVGGGDGYAAAHGSLVLTATGTTTMAGGWGATMDGTVSGCTATYKGTASGGGTDATVTAAVSAATAAVVAPPLPRPTPPFTEVNVRM